MEKIDFNTYPLSPEVLDELQSRIINEFKAQKKLWQGVYYMDENHIANLSELISNQKNGIILSFSGYANSTAQNYNWSHFVVPKIWINEIPNGAGHFFLLGGSGGPLAFKYLYIRNNQIQGHANNTGQHGDYNNSSMVLRYVWGF